MSQTNGRLDDAMEDTDADPESSRGSGREGETAEVEPTLGFDTIPPPPDEALPRWRTWAARIWAGAAVPGDVQPQPEGKGPAGDDNDVPPEVPGFTVREECGRGGMGVVYLAQQEGLGRTVVLKFLRPELAGSASLRARLRAEAVALAQLQHPNIVQVFGSGEHLGRAYIVQEYLPGGSLESRLAHEPKPARAAAELLRTLATAVGHAHIQKIIHRDLKPSNVSYLPGYTSARHIRASTRRAFEFGPASIRCADIWLQRLFFPPVAKLVLNVLSERDSSRCLGN